MSDQTQILRRYSVRVIESEPARLADSCGRKRAPRRLGSNLDSTIEKSAQLVNGMNGENSESRSGIQKVDVRKEGVETFQRRPLPTKTPRVIFSSFLTALPCTMRTHGPGNRSGL